MVFSLFFHFFALYLQKIKVTFQKVMLTEVKLYQCEFDRTPTDDDLLKCIEIAKEDDCIVHLQWCLKWSGNYYVQVTKDSTLETIKERLPKIYGI